MKKYYSVSGMHCRSCELLLEQHIGTLPGVQNVRVAYRTGVATVTFRHDTRPDDGAVARAVHTAGYTIGSNTRTPWISRTGTDWYEVLLAASIIFTLYLGYKLLGLDVLSSQITTSAGPASALLIGLLAGISTCMALIGGLVLGISSRHAQRNPLATSWQKFQPHLAFNAGRLLSFALLGGAIGALGSGLRITGGTLGVVVMLAGATMLVMGIKLVGLFPRLQSITLPSSITRLLGFGRTAAEYSHARTTLMGAFTFFIPCGFTQAMQIYAISTGSFVQGSMIMTAFAIGTLPGLLGVGGLSSIVQGAIGRMFFKVAGIAVLLLGLWNISNGWNLTGIVLTKATSTVSALNGMGSQTTTAQVRDGKQYISMEQNGFGYKPNRFIVKKEIPVVWTINSTNAYTCASSLLIPSLSIAKSLVPGINTIEFTPPQTGFIKFSCSMGMYTGLIEVTN